jgi:DNA-binding MarR family transcriptional regulator
LVARLDLGLPDYLPVVTHAMFVHKGESASSPDPHLPALLSQVLHAFTLEFERESEVSLAMSANVMRVLDEKGVRVRELPRLTGVSKQAISMSTGFLAKRGYVVVEPGTTAARSKLVRLTPKGHEAQDAYRPRLAEVEQRWQERYGEDTIRALRAALETLVGEPNWEASPLTRGLVPPAGGWRAKVRTPETLPYHPMVLHRGGWPDGS